MWLVQFLIMLLSFKTFTDTFHEVKSKRDKKKEVCVILMPNSVR